MFYKINAVCVHCWRTRIKSFVQQLSSFITDCVKTWSETKCHRYRSGCGRACCSPNKGTFWRSIFNPRVWCWATWRSIHIFVILSSWKPWGLMQYLVESVCSFSWHDRLFVKCLVTCSVSIPVYFHSKKERGYLLVNRVLLMWSLNLCLPLIFPLFLLLFEVLNCITG